jgi:hypothetical protein
VRRTPYINYTASRGNLWVGSCVDLLRCFRLACRSLVFALRGSPRRGAFRRMEGAPFIAVGAPIAGDLPRHARGKGGHTPSAPNILPLDSLSWRLLQPRSILR